MKSPIEEFSRSVETMIAKYKLNLDPTKLKDMIILYGFIMEARGIHSQRYNNLNRPTRIIKEYRNRYNQARADVDTVYRHLLKMLERLEGGDEGCHTEAVQSAVL